MAPEQPTEPEAETILSVRGLRVNFRVGKQIHEVVRDVDLTVRKGETVGLVGESGSGKSVSALSILGLLSPPGEVVAGSVVLNGVDLRRCSDDELNAIRGSQISLVYQDALTALDPVRTIGSQLVEALRVHRSISRREARALAIDLLEAVRVQDASSRLDDYPHEYSGGMRQRVAIAMALANDPDVVIADEPTTALDVTTQAQVLDLLSAAASDRGAAVVLITHDLGVVAEFCDAVVVMYAGTVVEEGPTESVLVQPRHPYTASLLGTQPRVGGASDRRLPTIEGHPPLFSELPPGCAFEPRCSVGNGLTRCRQEGPTLSGDDGTRVSCHFPLEVALR